MAEAIYCKADVVARALGFDTVASVYNLTKDGIIEKVDVKEGGRKVKRYDLVNTTNRYITHLKAKQAEKKDNSEALDADARYKKAKAEKMEIEISELKGRIYRSEDVEAVTTDIVYAVRSMLTALPGRLAVNAANCSTPTEASNVIRKECNELLEELTNHTFNPEEYAKRVRDREGWEDIFKDGDKETD